MPRTKEASQRIREEQRTKILQAARKVFARKGLAATVDDVAVEASVSHGLAYRYFASKEELIYALVKQDIPEPSAGLQNVQDMPGTPGERLNFLLSEFVKSRQHPEIYLLLGQVLSSDMAPPGLRELIHQRGLALQGVLRQLIIDGQATGEVAAGDPDQLVRAIFACLDGLIRWAVYYPDQYSDHFPDASIFLRMLKP
ncbi:TetR/AcrR family transcriptional regulator [Dictyobacter formicarum]|uniref:HTH tetR-type domain-containing protein n=1 Tax=Dictyobacter formicarum TaxID=2778368 RepID=A0ABQ3VKR6_9CHLR|nr:TetR/AcrR family transcriptional regulator [Dictyobacter formicarum]GHO85938.1 hypothetical protein KSZ_39440 [Dictyobacter formicarum]